MDQAGAKLHDIVGLVRGTESTPFGLAGIVAIVVGS